MSLFGAILKQGAKYADNLFDDVAVQAKKVVDDFDADEWERQNPRPNNDSSSKEYRTWSERRRIARHRSNTEGYDRLGQKIVEPVRYVDDDGNVLPVRSRKKAADMTPEEAASHRLYSRLKHKSKQDERNPNRRVKADVQNMTPEEKEAWNQDRLRKKREQAAARRARMTDEEVAAEKAKQKQWRDDNPEVIKARREKYREANADEIRRRQREAYQRDRESYLARSKAYREANPEKARQGRRNAYRKNKAEYIRKAREREGMVQQQTPAHNNTAAVNEIYRRAQELTEATGQQYVVDHVVPIKGYMPGSKLGSDDGRSVSGLNVQDNLLIVPENFNLSKGAWMEPGDDPMTINEVARRRLLQQAEEGLLGSIK